MMTPKEFTALYAEYFGEKAPLPIAVLYTDTPLGNLATVPGCMFKQFHRATRGETVSLDAKHLTCGGGKLYTGLAPAPERVFNFVSLVERYKITPEVARCSISAIDAQLSANEFINFARVDTLDSFNEMEGLIFFVTPDVLSGLFSWANFDQREINAVQSPWGSGCSTTVTTMVNENRRGGHHCYIGMLDVSARPYFKSNILSFAIPRSRLIEMTSTLSNCCVAGAPAWLKVKKRINRQ